MLKMFLDDLKLATKALAKPWNEYTVTEMADGFCDALDAEDEYMKNAWFGALLLNYQPMIMKLYKQHGSPLKLDFDDIVGWFTGAIMQACDVKNRSWKTKSCAAGTVIMQIVNTRYLAAAYYDSNLDIHRANYATVSLDTPIDNDTETTRADLLESDYATPSDAFNSAYCVIQELIDDNKIVEAIIAETIAYNDCYKVNSKVIKEVSEDGTIKRYKNVVTSFWPYRVVQILSNLPENYEDYFINRFNISKEKFEVGFNKIKTSKNPKLYDYLEKTQECLRSYV